MVMGVWSAACSTPLPRQTSGPPAKQVCVPTAESTVSQESRNTIADFQRTVESTPLFTISARHAGVSSCRIGYESGMASVEYQFRDGGWLRSKRDSRIEYSDQEVRFAVPLAESPIAILTDAERAAFGDSGCGMDWKETETTPAEDDRTAVEVIYRGDTCNCQARIRSDAGGRVTGLVFRSAC
jgi:hypothetical protein